MNDFLQILRAVPGVAATFVERIEGVDADGERDEVLGRLQPHHEAVARQRLGVAAWWRAEQVHGSAVARIGVQEDDPAAARPVPGVDGLVTIEPGQALGIYVADCGPIWLADAGSGAVGVLHSGKKGTAANILRSGLEEMRRAYGTRPGNVVGVLGPCIRPPDYEIDFAATIGHQAAELGLGEWVDCGENTARDPARFYSYRREKGRTGRMLALILRQAQA